jgi:hypothetical protein
MSENLAVTFQTGVLNATSKAVEISSKALARLVLRYDHFTLAIFLNVISPLQVELILTLQAAPPGP